MTRSHRSVVIELIVNNDDVHTGRVFAPLRTVRSVNSPQVAVSWAVPHTQLRCDGVKISDIGGGGFCSPSIEKGQFKCQVSKIRGNPWTIGTQPRPPGNLQRSTDPASVTIHNGNWRISTCVQQQVLCVSDDSVLYGGMWLGKATSVRVARLGTAHVTSRPRPFPPFSAV